MAHPHNHPFLFGGLGCVLFSVLLWAQLSEEFQEWSWVSLAPSLDRVAILQRLSLKLHLLGAYVIKQ